MKILSLKDRIQILENTLQHIESMGADKFNKSNNGLCDWVDYHVSKHFKPTHDNIDVTCRVGIKDYRYGDMKIFCLMQPEECDGLSYWFPFTEQGYIRRLSMLNKSIAKLKSRVKTKPTSNENKSTQELDSHIQLPAGGDSGVQVERASDLNDSPNK